MAEGFAPTRGDPSKFEFVSFNFLSPPFFFQPPLFVSFLPTIYSFPFPLCSPSLKAHRSLFLSPIWGELSLSQTPFPSLHFFNLYSIIAELRYRKRARGDSAEFGNDPKTIREDLLSILNDFDTIPDDRNSPSRDVDSVIRSFEEEISGSGTRPGSPKPENLVDLTSDSGDSLLELGRLSGYDDFRAPASSCEGSELLRVSSESSGIGEFWDLRDELPSYHSFGFGMGYVEYDNSYSGQGDNNEYMALDGIFEYSDVNFGSDGAWRLETLAAL